MATIAIPAVVSAPAPAHPVERLMRDRAGLLADVGAGRDLAAIARAMIATIAIGGALFGAAIGIYRGGIQIAYAAIKLPLVLVLTAALATPALAAFNLALDRPARLARDLALALCALALGALVLAALAPVILVARALDASYHQTALVVVVCCAGAGLAALAVLIRGLRHQAAAWAGTAAALLCAVTMVVGAQLAWTLRPYLVRPRATSVPFVRDVEGSLVESVVQTYHSIEGDYDRASAPLPASEEALPPGEVNASEAAP